MFISDKDKVMKKPMKPDDMLQTSFFLQILSSTGLVWFCFVIKE